MNRERERGRENVWGTEQRWGEAERRGGEVKGEEEGRGGGCVFGCGGARRLRFVLALKIFPLLGASFKNTGAQMIFFLIILSLSYHSSFCCCF